MCRVIISIQSTDSNSHILTGLTSDRIFILNRKWKLESGHRSFFKNEAFNIFIFTGLSKNFDNELTFFHPIV